MNTVAQNQTKPSFFELISQARSDKFDLLGQLILNQRESLVLCGVEGIGKTTFLQKLTEVRDELWVVCFIKATVELSFEIIETQLINTLLAYNPKFKDQDSSVLLSFYQKQQKKIVLAIDDAVYLPAGLVNQLIEYALLNPVIRIVFALTKGQMYLKNSTDRAIDDCYFVEIPPLQKDEIQKFLYYLARIPDGIIVEEDISESIVVKLYRQTLGIPEKIITDLPPLLEKEYKNTSVGLYGVILLGVVGVLIGINQFIRTGDESAKTSSTISSLVSGENLTTETLHSKQQSRVIAGKNKTATQLEIKSAKKPELINEDKKQTDAKIESLPVELAIESKVEKLDDNQWVLTQPPKKYTLQLMVLTKKQSLEAIFVKHPQLLDSLKYIDLKAKNQKKYVLLYGSFTSIRLARAAILSLPKEFQQAWPRRFYALQKELKRR